MSIADNIRRLKTDIDEVYKAGVASGSNAFWDAYLTNADTVECRYMFAGSHWTDETFKPNKTIQPRAARFMFQNSDVTKVSKNQIDFSKSTELRNCFDSSNITELDFNSSSATNLSNTFAGCTNLRVLNYEGTIKGNLDLSDTTMLSLDSLKSVLLACNGNGSGKTITFSSYCIDGETNTFSTIVADNDAHNAYRAALDTYGYSIAFN